VLLLVDAFLEIAGNKLFSPAHFRELYYQGHAVLKAAAKRELPKQQWKFILALLASHGLW
jgi:hypothetical protein